MRNTKFVIEVVCWMVTRKSVLTGFLDVFAAPMAARAAFICMRIAEPENLKKNLIY